MSCQLNIDMMLLQWMDFANSTIVPFFAMLVLSISLIYFVRLSRSRANKLSIGRIGSQSRRDNRFAVTAISLNLIFFVLNLPSSIILVMGSLNTDSNVVLGFNQLSLFLYYLYYAIGFYIQLLVNSEFRIEFFKLIHLKPI